MANSKWCTQCGAENDTAAAFCKSCGKPMSGSGRASEKTNAVLANAKQDQPAKQQQYGFQNQITNKAGYGFQAQSEQKQEQFQAKPKLKPTNSAGLGFSAYISVVALVIGVVLFFFGQQQLDSYAGLTWYYTKEAAAGNFLRVSGGLCCILGVIGLIRYFVVKK